MAMALRRAQDRRWLTLALVATTHEGAAGGGEEAALGVDLFEVVLAFDEGVLAAESLDFALDVGGVGWDFEADLVGVVGEDAADPVTALLGPKLLDAGREEGVAGPGGAKEDAGDVGGCAHGQEVFGPLSGADVLGLVGFEQDVGGGADDVGGGVGAEEERPRQWGTAD